MKEICGNCKWGEKLPFTENTITCMNENSDYADCDCKENDTCEWWEDGDTNASF